MSKKQSLEKLREIIDEFSTVQTHMFYRNSFALCCYLITKGEIKAAKKQLNYLFDTLGWDNRKTYFSAILSSVEEFAVEYAGDIRANLEINNLFDKSEFYGKNIEANTSSKIDS